MKSLLILFVFNGLATFLYAQNGAIDSKTKQAIHTLIDRYAQAREKKDTLMLKQILTNDIDQLVSSGEWRNGVRESVKGMLRSSDTNSGSRKIIIDKIRMLNLESALVDARYEIKNADGTERKMWSTFIVVLRKEGWKISAIRNMLPSK